MTFEVCDFSRNGKKPLLLLPLWMNILPLRGDIFKHFQFYFGTPTIASSVLHGILYLLSYLICFRGKFGEGGAGRSPASFLVQ